MPSKSIKKSVYRQRGYECSNCKAARLVFGQEEEPTTCLDCDRFGTLVKKWDHLVTDTTTVQDYAYQVIPV